MDYLLKTSAVILIFYGFYKLILQRETFFQSNRWFLLVGILAAVLVPLIVIPIYVEQPIFLVQNFSDSVSNNMIIPEETIDWIGVLKFIYLGGVFFFCGKFVFNLTSLVKLITSNSKEKNGNYNFIKTDKNTSPFSFFSFIVFNPNQFKNNELEQIITHEKIHAHQLHSIDILLSQVVSIIFWFNPIIWLYKKEIQQNLEFIADDLAQQKSASEKSYQRLLLKSSLPENRLALTNNFYNSLIKKRIIMLHKNRSKSTNQWKYTLILPLIALFMMSFNTEKVFITNDDTVFTVSSETTTQELKSIEKYFKNTPSLLKFTDIKRNSKSELTNISINIKNKTDKRFIKKMTIKGGENSIKIGEFNLSLIESEVIFTPKGEKNSILVSDNKTTFYEDFTIGEHHLKKETEKTIITKDSKKSEFNDIKKRFLKNGVTVNFKKVKRNNKGEITEIAIDASSSSTNSTYSISADKPIKPIVISYNENGEDIFIETLGADHKNGYLRATNANAMRDNRTQKSKKESTFVFISDEKENHNDKNNTKTYTSRNGSSSSHTTSSSSTIETIEGGNKNENKIFISNKSNNYLCFIDGKKITKEELDKFPSGQIKKMEVIKGDEAIEKYGEKGKNGVILITTKKEK